MTISVNALFHFTRRKKYFYNLFKKGIFPRYSLEDYRTILDENSPRIAFPMKCFCDIPLSKINEEHVGYYGKYGIGLNAKWRDKNRLNPIIYIKKDSNVNQLLKQIFNKNQYVNNRYLNEYQELLIKHIKPYEGMQKKIRGKEYIKVFYNEKEWRYIPIDINDRGNNIQQFINEKDFNNKKRLKYLNFQLINDKYKLHFDHNDIRYIITPSEKENAILIDFLKKHVKEKWNMNEREYWILCSKIISLEQIKNDF